jgi:uncharacterized protein
MAENSKPEVGTITWFDLTVPNAEKVRDFYTNVVGWKPENVEMGGYNDFTMMTPETGNPIAGVCHARGGNAEIPPQWMMYITVENVDESANQVGQLGGKILVGPKDMSGYGRYCIIQDPAGAVCGLFETKTDKP